MEQKQCWLLKIKLLILDVVIIHFPKMLQSFETFYICDSERQNEGIESLESPQHLGEAGIMWYSSRELRIKSHYAKPNISF